MKIKGRYKSISWLVVAVILIIFVNGNHSAASGFLPLKFNIQSGTRSDQLPDSPAGEISLFLDDGSVENAIGIVGGTSSFIFFNRFTPDPSLFPFELTSYQVFFPSAIGVTVGDEINLFVYEDADGNPANGATLLLNYPATIKALDAWNEYVPVLAEPLLIKGPGDVLIGIEALETPGTDYLPASIDTTNSQQRSWIGNSFLDPGSVGIIDSFGYPGNWMIRGYAKSTGTTRYLYLPFMFKPLPSPVLSPINNPNGEANYSVSWNSVVLAASYVLEEDDDGAFSSPVIAYSGASTSWSTSSHAFGTYYYRVKARNSLGDSAWSNLQSTTVIPPQSHAYVDNDTGCTLCFEVFDTGIGQKCFSSSGSQFYGSFPVGDYRWTASACCGSMSDSDYFGSTWSYSFYCTSSVGPQLGPSTLQCAPQLNGLTQSDSTRLP
jgi:hypothetical protein